MAKSTYSPIISEIGAVERDCIGSYCAVDDGYLFCSSKGLVIWDLVKFKKVYTNSQFKWRILFAYYKDRIMLIWSQNKLYFFNYQKFTYSLYKEFKNDFRSMIMVTPSILILSSNSEIYILNLDDNSFTIVKYKEKDENSTLSTFLFKISEELIIVDYNHLDYVIDWKKQKVVNIFDPNPNRICLVDKRNGQMYIYPQIPDTNELLIVPPLFFDQFYNFSLLPAVQRPRGKIISDTPQLCLIKNSNYYIEKDVLGNIKIYEINDRTPIIYKTLKSTRQNIFFSTSNYLMQETQMDEKVRIYKILRNRL